MAPAPNFEQVREHIAHDAYARFLGIELLALRPGYSKVAMTVRAEFMNFHGILHGGAVFSLADAAFGAAANAHNQVAVALNVSVNFLAPVAAGARLTAEATEENLGRRTALYRLAVSAEDGTLVALCHGTVYRKEQALVP